jgi:4-amino-4-deoxy-L-arabinose transferase-like glycosyltransferase
MLRFMSWVFYVVFSMYSLRLLHMSRLPKFSCHLCAVLFLLWPAGFHLASKINSESLYYALYAVAFYHAIKWYEQGKERHLMKAAFWAATSITVRTNGIIILTIIAALVLIALLRRRILLQDFFTRQWLGVGIFLLLCIATNMGKVIFYHYSTLKLKQTIKLEKNILIQSRILQYQVLF